MQRKNGEYKKTGIFEDYEAREPGLRECWKPIAAVFVVAVMVICGLAVWQWNESQKLQEAGQARIDGQKAVAAGMVNLPQRTGKTGNQKMVQIPRGTTGQADFVGELGCSVGGYGGVDTWTVAGASSAVPAGWNLNQDGVVTIPMSAALGSQSGIYVAACEYESTPGEFESGEKGLEYEFEVVENNSDEIEFFGGILAPEGDPVNACPGVKLTFGVDYNIVGATVKIHAASDTGHDAAEAYVYPFTPIAPPDGSEWPGDHGKVKVPQLPAGDYFLHVDCEVPEVPGAIGLVDMPFTIPENCPKRRAHMAF